MYPVFLRQCKHNLLKVLFRIGVEIFNKHVSLMYVQPELKYMVPISRLLAIFCNFTNASERLYSCN